MHTVSTLSEELTSKYGAKVSGYHIRRLCDLAEARGACIRRIAGARVIPASIAKHIERQLLAANVIHKPAHTT